LATIPLLDQLEVLTLVTVRASLGTGVSAQLQMRVPEVLGDLEGHGHATVTGVASYIDDLGLYGTTFEEYLQRLQTMLETRS
jgi:hypothetical protein